MKTSKHLVEWLIDLDELPVLFHITKGLMECVSMERAKEAKHGLARFSGSPGRHTEARCCEKILR